MLAKYPTVWGSVQDAAGKRQLVKINIQKGT